MIPVKNCYNYFWLCQYCFYSGPRLERTLVHSHSLRNYLDQRVRICHQKLASLEDIRVKVRPKQLLWPQKYQGFQFLQVTLLTQSLTTHWNLNVRVRGGNAPNAKQWNEIWEKFSGRGSKVCKPGFKKKSRKKNKKQKSAPRSRLMSLTGNRCFLFQTLDAIEKLET